MPFGTLSLFRPQTEMLPILVITHKSLIQRTANLTTVIAQAEHSEFHALGTEICQFNARFLPGKRYG